MLGKFILVIALFYAVAAYSVSGSDTRTAILPRSLPLNQSRLARTLHRRGSDDNGDQSDAKRPRLHQDPEGPHGSQKSRGSPKPQGPSAGPDRAYHGDTDPQLWQPYPPLPGSPVSLSCYYFDTDPRLDPREVIGLFENVLGEIGRAHLAWNPLANVIGLKRKHLFERHFIQDSLVFWFECPWRQSLPWQWIYDAIRLMSHWETTSISANGLGFSESRCQARLETGNGFSNFAMFHLVRVNPDSPQSSSSRHGPMTPQRTRTFPLPSR